MCIMPVQVRYKMYCVRMFNTFKGKNCFHSLPKGEMGCYKTMRVVFKKPKNEDLIEIHNDLIVETCRSFGTTIADKPKGNTVILSKGGGVDLSSYSISKLVQIECIMIGCDDNFEPDEIQGLDSIRIETPVDYFLWSGVALGIFLHHLHISSQRKIGLKQLI